VSYANSPTTSAPWPWPTPTSCRCCSPARWPPRRGGGCPAPFGRWKTSWNCSPAPGSPPPDALHAYRLFFGFLHGHVLHELQELIDNPDETDDLLRLGLHRLPLAQFPRLRALAGELAGYDGATQLHQGVEMMITGLQSHFKPANSQTQPQQ